MENDKKDIDSVTVRKAGSVCPLMANSGWEAGDADCCRELCGWWVYERECCAIQMLAREAVLSRLGGQTR